MMVAPAPTGAFALQGQGESETAFRDVREEGGQMVAVVNLWDRRTTATNDAMDAALKESTVPVLRMRIPRSEAINQAGLGYEAVFDTGPSAPSVEELRELAKGLGRRSLKARHLGHLPGPPHHHPQPLQLEPDVAPERPEHLVDDELLDGRGKLVAPGRGLSAQGP